MLTVRSLYAVSQAETKAMDATGLRDNFHSGGLFAPGEIRLVYTHYDRMIVGGITPDNGDLTLDAVKECGTESILDRREIGILNVGDTAQVTADGAAHSLNRGDVLYLGMGAGPVTFGTGGRFYIVSTPAHRALPAKLIKIEQAGKVKLGAPETANDRTIYQFIHPDVMESCQLVMGYTMFHGGSVWNTMPAHVHDRRMEAYFYFDLADDNRVFHFMGEPDETRHIVMRNEEAVISPPWSIHCGCGTGSYTFCWAMAGDNVDYKDVEMVAMEDLR
ncbi:5-dehydro-4-deoxy-D-glucuronate isomerase [Thalassococcus sp. CAU 1522]|uniref:4-deoxy-L-threo-5-hexosulose-uronate ketol-isomerase n=1 Tax=Thalassococcus arenae TaxID=2851652 RepID=A0ABS6ND08_9RHOB|nr:5-dehydro-4-deoxy-D-glucuronate isomerase [Thalassococcus arenae]MBV2361577.1 5-dehydro-4-deoxy-D-glucuronate isomerase [Thalassococcus arenae]